MRRLLLWWRERQSNGCDFLVKLIDEIITAIFGRQNELSHILTIRCIYFYLTVVIFFNKILNSAVWDTNAVLQADPPNNPQVIAIKELILG